MKVMDFLENFLAAGKDPPLLRRLLKAIDDDAIFPRSLANVVIKPSEFIKGPGGQVHVRPGESRPASEEELLSFRALCKDAMRDLYKCALFLWIDDMNPDVVEFARSIELGTSLIERYHPVLHFKYGNFREAIIYVAERQDHSEEDATQFLYFMLGVFLVSREELFWQDVIKREGSKKPWQHL